jgi:hypothetical protein
MRFARHGEANANRAGKFIFAVIWRCTIDSNRTLSNAQVQLGKKSAHDWRRSRIFSAPKNAKFCIELLYPKLRILHSPHRSEGEALSNAVNRLSAATGI